MYRLFRGIDINTNKLVYGYAYPGWDSYYKDCSILINASKRTLYKCIPKTVGQDTLLKDSTGKRIFEGDYLQKTDNPTCKGRVLWDWASLSYIVKYRSDSWKLAASKWTIIKRVPKKLIGVEQTLFCARSFYDIKQMPPVQCQFRKGYPAPYMLLQEQEEDDEKEHLEITSKSDLSAQLSSWNTWRFMYGWGPLQQNYLYPNTIRQCVLSYRVEGEAVYYLCEGDIVQSTKDNSIVGVITYQNAHYYVRLIKDFNIELPTKGESQSIQAESNQNSNSKNLRNLKILSGSIKELPRNGLINTCILTEKQVPWTIIGMIDSPKQRFKNPNQRVTRVTKKKTKQ